MAFNIIKTGTSTQSAKTPRSTVTPLSLNSVIWPSLGRPSMSLFLSSDQMAKTDRTQPHSMMTVGFYDQASIKLYN